MKHVETLLPLNLQFFADDPTTPATPDVQAASPETGTQTPNDGGNEPQNDTQEPQEPQYTVEGLLAQLAEQKATIAKMKSDHDKLMKSEGEMRKKLNAKLSAEEQAAQAAAEQQNARDEHLHEVERELAVIKATNRYLEMGMDKELAASTAEAEVDNNREIVTLNIQKYQDEWKKNTEKAIRQEYLDQMPTPASGNNGEVDYGKSYQEALNNGDASAAIGAMLQHAVSAGQISL